MSSPCIAAPGNASGACAHTSWAGLPNAGRSRISTGIGSWASAPHPTTRTPDNLGGRLDLDDHLVRRLAHCYHSEPRQPQQRLRQPDTVPHLRGLVAFVVVTSDEDSRTPDPRGRPSATRPPQFNAIQAFNVCIEG
jgi:hypothetical protein